MLAAGSAIPGGGRAVAHGLGGHQGQRRVNPIGQATKLDQLPTGEPANQVRLGAHATRVGQPRLQNLRFERCLVQPPEDVVVPQGVVDGIARGIEPNEAAADGPTGADGVGVIGPGRNSNRHGSLQSGHPRGIELRHGSPSRLRPHGGVGAGRFRSAGLGPPRVKLTRHHPLHGKPIQCGGQQLRRLGLREHRHQHWTPRRGERRPQSNPSLARTQPGRIPRHRGHCPRQPLQHVLHRLSRLGSLGNLLAELHDVPAQHHRLRGDRDRCHRKTRLEARPREDLGHQFRLRPTPGGFLQAGIRHPHLRSRDGHPVIALQRRTRQGTRLLPQLACRQQLSPRQRQVFGRMPLVLGQRLCRRKINASPVQNCRVLGRHRLAQDRADRSGQVKWRAGRLARHSPPRTRLNLRARHEWQQHRRRHQPPNQTSHDHPWIEPDPQARSPHAPPVDPATFTHLP